MKQQESYPGCGISVSRQKEKCQNHSLLHSSHFAIHSDPLIQYHNLGDNNLPSVSAVLLLSLGCVMFVEAKDECQVTPVIHVLQYPGCVPKPIPSFACTGRCSSYLQVTLTVSHRIKGYTHIQNPNILYIAHYCVMEQMWNSTVRILTFHWLPFVGANMFIQKEHMVA